MREARIQTVIEISRLPPLAAAEDRGADLPGSGRIRHPRSLKATRSPQQLHAHRARAVGVHPNRNGDICHGTGSQTAGGLPGWAVRRSDRTSRHVPRARSMGRGSRVGVHLNRAHRCGSSAQGGLERLPHQASLHQIQEHHTLGYAQLVPKPHPL